MKEEVLEKLKEKYNCEDCYYYKECDSGYMNNELCGDFYTEELDLLKN